MLCMCFCLEVSEVHTHSIIITYSFSPWPYPHNPCGCHNDLTCALSLPPVVNVSVEQSFVSFSELAGSVQVDLVKTDNAVGQVSVIVSTMDGTAQGMDLKVVVVNFVLVNFMTELLIMKIILTKHVCVMYNHENLELYSINLIWPLYQHNCFRWR